MLRVLSIVVVCAVTDPALAQCSARPSSVPGSIDLDCGMRSGTLDRRGDRYIGTLDPGPLDDLDDIRDVEVDRSGNVTIGPRLFPAPSPRLRDLDTLDGLFPR